MRAKDDCNQLLNVALPFAEKMLREHGGFLHFGVQMLADGEISLVGADNGEDHSQPRNLASLLQNAFKVRADEGSLIATALVYNVRVALPEEGQMSDAIALNFDHRDSYSIKVFFPYAIAHGEPKLREPFANRGDYATFPAI